MRIRLFLGLFLSLFSVCCMTAQDISGKILDDDNGQPIPYASIQFGVNNGVISNEEGSFSIYTQKTVDSLVISSLGYETVLLIEFGKDMEVRLKPESTELQEVYLSDEEISGKEIIERVMANIDRNYDLGINEQKFFYRKSNNQLLGLDLDLKKSSIDEISQGLLDDISSNIPQEVGSYVEVAGTLYGDYDEQKLSIVKAANLYNASGSEQLEELAHQMENIIKDNITDGSFLKIRTGLLGFKIDSEELSEGLQELESNSESEEAPTPQEIEERELKRREYFQTSTQRSISDLFDKMFWKEDQNLDIFSKSRRYDFHLEGYTTLDGHAVYIIDVEPKRRADFKGKVYVNIEDYGVHRLEFENVKNLSSFKLFGISRTEDLFSGKMIFSRNASGKYSPAYLEQQYGARVGIDRPVKIIERNREVPGRNKQNQLKMGIEMAIRDVSTYQFYVHESQAFDEMSYETLVPSTDYQLETFEEYNSEYWEGTTIVEPNTAIRQYSTIQP